MRTNCTRMKRVAAALCAASSSDGAALLYLTPDGFLHYGTRRIVQVF